MLMRTYDNVVWIGLFNGCIVTPTTKRAQYSSSRRFACRQWARHDWYALAMIEGAPDYQAQLAAIAELDELLSRHRVSYWLFGGWAVDFHAGRVTREHADIDIAIWVDDRERIAKLLLERSWAHHPEDGEDGYTRYERDGVQLEVAFLAQDERGQAYTPLRDGRGEWPENSFGDDVAQLRGVRARVIDRDSLISDKSVVRSDPATAAKDRVDVGNLRR
jgi:Aminoglycoside-2''-adenylyltransferase